MLIHRPHVVHEDGWIHEAQSALQVADQL